MSDLPIYLDLFHRTFHDTDVIYKDEAKSRWSAVRREESATHNNCTA